ncbi:MAG: zinc-binding dehydrogenase [Acidimicrobiales bacterium]
MVRGIVNRPGPDGPVTFEELEEPSPGPGEALVRVGAFSVNRGELSLLARRPTGWAPGQDVAGTVGRQAADGSGPPAGTRVVGRAEQGGWSELVPIATERLAVLPESVTLEVAATLPIAGLTALRTLRLGGDLLARRVLVTGASGGVGRFHIELAAASGATVWAVTGRAEQAAGLRGLGAERVIGNVSDAKGRFDLALESVGGASLAGAVRSLAPRGTIVVFGNSSGETTSLQMQDFIGHEGGRIVTYMSYAWPEPDGPDLGRLVELLASGRLHPTLGHVSGWQETAGALSLLRERRLVGKAVLTLPEG